MDNACPFGNGALIICNHELFDAVCLLLDACDVRLQVIPVLNVCALCVLLRQRVIACRLQTKESKNTEWREGQFMGWDSWEQAGGKPHLPSCLPAARCLVVHRVTMKITMFMWQANALRMNFTQCSCMVTFSIAS